MIRQVKEEVWYNQYVNMCAGIATVVRQASGFAKAAPDKQDERAACRR
jgi:hypothetical protein